MLGIPKDQMYIAWITTGTKVARDKTFYETHKKALITQGYQFEEMDIEGKNEEELYKMFAGKQVIHMEGGNTFYLLNAVRESGFENVLRRLLDEGITYVGSSAGAYITCPTIEMMYWKPKGHPTYGVTDLKAMNLVPFLLLVHYKDELEHIIKEKIKTASHPVRILRDGQGILVENGKYTFVGDGEEVKL